MILILGFGLAYILTILLDHLRKIVLWVCALGTGGFATNIVLLFYQEYKRVWIFLVISNIIYPSILKINALMEFMSQAVLGQEEWFFWYSQYKR